MNTHKNSLMRKFMTVLMLLFIFTSNVQLFAKQQDANKPAGLFEMSIEQLMEVEVKSTATLTEVKPRLVPAAVTTITAEDIQASGARSLFELLDIYVPNLQWWRNHWEADNMGLRGILSDHDDKYLLLVNGRVMNERTHYGALSERDLVLLRDIHHIDVVRGPGSALYGPGAVAMVINIVTHNADTFQGTEVTSRLGAIEEFYSGEIKHGQKFKDGDGGIFTYVGIGEYRGANAQDAPQIYGVDFSIGSPMPQEKGKPFTSPSINDEEDERDLPPVKLYAEINKGNWDIWARYTRGGKQFVWGTGALSHSPFGWSEWVSPPAPPYGDCFYGYQQATGFLGYKKDLDDKTNMDLSFSYDMFDFERRFHTSVLEAFREDKYISKLVIRRDINKQHKIAIGTELLHGEYGYPSPGWPIGNDAIDGAFSKMPRWSTNMYSLFGEHQWTINDQWTSFLGARIDDHTYTTQMFSPRASLVYTPNTKDTYKIMWARSVRANSEEEMKKLGASESIPEKLDSLEFRYERKHSKNLDLAVSAFSNYNLEVIGYSTTTKTQAVVGTMRDCGIEAEATYHTERTRLMISHSYTKLINFQVAGDPTLDNAVQFSAKPYGYGDDLQRWANHLTKVTARRKLDDKWTLDGSLRIYWNFPGLKDYAKYWADHSGYPLNWERSYRGSYYLDIGLQNQPSKDLTFRVDGYNLLGIFNKDFNKRNYGGEGYADFRSQAVAVGVSVTYKF